MLTTYTEHLHSIGIDPTTLVLDAGGTLVSDRLSEPVEVTAATGLVIGETLGQSQRPRVGWTCSTASLPRQPPMMPR